MADIRRWLPDPPDLGQFRFRPEGAPRPPCLVVMCDDGRGPVYVSNPEFGQRKFDTHEDADTWMRANGYGSHEAPKRHPEP